MKRTLVIVVGIIVGVLVMFFVAVGGGTVLLTGSH
jgi:hypothetical protein